MSRYSRRSDVHLLAPLWRTRDERRAIIATFVNMSRLNEDLKADLRRLHRLATATAARLGIAAPML